MKLAKGLILGITAVSAAIALYLLIIGVPATTVEAIGANSAAVPLTRVENEPYFPAILLLLAMILLAVGILRQRRLTAWAGIIGSFLFSLLFLFSGAIYFLPATILLFILLFWLSRDGRTFLNSN
jgi:uncharacterized membrane protein YgdD (TMEM256/DUF423 family)